jgi:hypothetical protein
LAQSHPWNGKQHHHHQTTTLEHGMSFTSEGLKRIESDDEKHAAQWETNGHSSGHYTAKTITASIIPEKISWREQRKQRESPMGISRSSHMSRF